MSNTVIILAIVGVAGLLYYNSIKEEDVIIVKEELPIIKEPLPAISSGEIEKLEKIQKDVDKLKRNTYVHYILYPVSSVVAVGVPIVAYILRRSYRLYKLGNQAPFVGNYYEEMRMDKGFDSDTEYVSINELSSEDN